MRSFNLTKEKHFWLIVINSLSYFMLAYLAVIFLTNAFSLLLARIEGVGGTLTYFGVDLSNAPAMWSSELTFLIFFFGIGFSALLGLFAERYYKKHRRYSTHYKLLFLWVFYLGFTYFLGNIVVGAFFYFGPGVIFDELNLSFFFRIPIGLLALVALVYLGVYACRSFIISLNCYQKIIERSELAWFLKAQMLYPVIIGNVFIVLLKVPHHNDLYFLDTLIWATSLVPAISMMLTARKQSSIRFKKEPPPIHLLRYPLLAFIILALLYRFGLGGIG